MSLKLINVLDNGKQALVQTEGGLYKVVNITSDGERIYMLNSSMSESYVGKHFTLVDNDGIGLLTKEESDKVRKGETIKKYKSSGYKLTLNDIAFIDTLTVIELRSLGFVGANLSIDVLKHKGHEGQEPLPVAPIEYQKKIGVAIVLDVALVNGYAQVISQNNANLTLLTK